MIQRILLRCGLLGLMLAGCLTPCRADAPDADATQAQTEYDQTLASYNAAAAKFRTVYAQAASDEEKKKLIATENPRIEQFAPRLWTLVQKHPDAPAAFDALSWLAGCNAGKNSDGLSPLDLLRARYVKSDKLAPLCRNLIYSGGDVEPFLQAVLADNSTRHVRAAACLSLGQIAKRDGRPAEAERFFNQVVADFGDLPAYQDATMGVLAQRELFEMHGLVVGQPAPEITGTDVDGKEFKLSDYRGKVVVVDFWGRW